MNLPSLPPPQLLRYAGLVLFMGRFPPFNIIKRSAVVALFHDIKTVEGSLSFYRIREPPWETRGPSETRKNEQIQHFLGDGCSYRRVV